MIKYFFIPAFILITACSQEPGQLQERPVVIDSEPIQRPDLNLPDVDRYNGREVEWIIVTKQNAEQKLQELQEQGKPVALFALTETGYENLSINLQNALKIIRQQQSVIDGYQEYYIVTNNRITQHNSEQ